MIEVKNLDAGVEGSTILRDVSLCIEPGTRKLLMGPNGSGKTTLVRVLVGDPSVEVKKGTVSIIDKNGSEADFLVLAPHERARRGLFVAFQSPVALPGVRAYAFLYTAYSGLFPEKAKEVGVEAFGEQLEEQAGKLGIEVGMLNRGVNEGFSGGERKKLELLQMLALDPTYVVLDEPDSGLDADSIRLVKKTLDMLPDRVGVLLISHDPRRLEIDRFDEVLVMKAGRMLERGGSDIVNKVLAHGYA